MVARAIGLSMGGPKGPVAVRITSGARRWCAVFGQASVRQDTGDRFRASDADAPAIADCDDDTLIAAASLCGDGVVEQSEEGDGAAGACVAEGWQCRPPGFTARCRCCGDGPRGFAGCCDPPASRFRAVSATHSAFRPVATSRSPARRPVGVWRAATAARDSAASASGRSRRGRASIPAARGWNSV